VNIPQTDVFDTANARALVLASRDAYTLPDAVWDFPPVFDEATETRVVFRCVGGGDLLVAFRGTADIRNWLTDLDVAFAYTEFGRVHKGFTDALDSVWWRVKQRLAPHIGKRWWFTGHSSGGALALLAARRLADVGEVCGVYTFGQPRVGDRAFAVGCDAALRQKHFRVVRGADIVPHVPYLLGSYRHSGHDMFFPDGGDCREDAPLWWQARGEVAAIVRKMTTHRFAPIEEHFVVNYVAMLHEPYALAQRPVQGREA